MEAEPENMPIRSASTGQFIEQPSLLPISVVSDLPAMVRAELAKSTPARQAQFVEEFQRKRKSKGVAYLLWFLLGWHYAYVRKWGTQILFWCTAGGVGVWWLVDVFRVKGLVRDYNKDTATAVLRDMVMISGRP